MYEEIGLTQDHVTLIGSSPQPIVYDLPAQHRQGGAGRRQPIAGQSMRWFLLRAASRNLPLSFDEHDTPEFQSATWVNYWYPVHQIVDFKRDFVRKGLVALQRTFVKEVEATTPRSR